MKSLKKIILSIIISILCIFLIFFVLLSHIKNINNINKNVELKKEMCVEIVCLDGYKYGIKYLISKNFVRTDTVVIFDIDCINCPINKNSKKSTVEDIFFESFKYCIMDSYQKGFLIKRDSLLEEMLSDYYTIKMDYYKNINKK